MRKVTLNLTFVMIIMALALLVQQSASAEPEEVLVWNPPGTLVPNSGKGDTPQIIQAPNGNLMIVYNRWITVSSGGVVTDSDPYYSVSTNNGNTWSNAAVMIPNTLTRSFVSATYDSNSKPHAVWVEIIEGGINTYRVLYSNQVGSNWSAPVTIASVDSFDVIQHAEIVESRPGVLDIVWDGPLNGQMFGSEIKHVRSTNGGLTWSGAAQVSTGPSVKILPTLAADVSGNLSVAWQEQAAGAAQEVYVSRLSAAGGAVWSTPLLLSENPSIADEALTPEIMATNAEIIVAFVSKISLDQQDVYFTACPVGNACTTSAEWSIPKPISNGSVSVNPGDQIIVTPSLSFGPKSRYLHFHGIPIGGSQNNEALWGTQSCTGWNSGDPDQVTSLSARSVRPTTTVKDDLIHLAYERIAASDNHEIYYLNNSILCETFNFLPLINK